ncbi:MAG: Archaemetzincin [Candidatus Methanofastidiosum methylothiophilum]|uniref:Archaemetzincin n=1 Tax=Candidatus Methanofastidiosum methylothiophilum TaxID=1705564 RepID=A0A150J4J8_9EURY|nr:MAG: Archaemetzincin [Candidatus Methanofastidiosum methylthiophilus]NMC76901.1 hypothetical protein [Candidatus Methanofastidiosa archaeon]
MTYDRVYIRLAAAGDFDKKFLFDFQKELQNVLYDNGIKATCFYNNSGTIEVDKIPSGAYTSHIGKYNTHSLFSYGQTKREDSLKRLGQAAILLKVLVIVDVEIFKQGFAGLLFGEAEVGKDIAIISTAPLENHFKSTFLIKERALKEALHELGHTLGLDHCKNPGCAMNISKDIYDIDEKKKKYCIDCLNILFRGHR